MGNANSRNKSSNKIETDISRNLRQSTKLTTAARTKYCKEDSKVNVGGTTAATTAATTKGGRILVDVRNTTTKTTTFNSNKAVKDPQEIQYYNRNQRQQKAADSSALSAVAEQQRIKQASSFWSLGSLYWNLSYSGRSSYKQRQKSCKKDFSTLQYQRKRSKTQWHKPITNAIFSSHFKESSRNQEFHIDELVAKGAFGVVFKVTDKKPINNEQQRQQKDKHLIEAKTSCCHPPVYALKVLKKSKIISENSLQQLKDEVDIQKLCGHHPFIVEQVDLWQNRYNLHILSEYIPNGELFSTIRTFPLNLIRLYLAEIALALDFLHNAGIIYRDAKPENILLTHNYHLKLTDFGLSKWLKLGLTTKTMCGTFQYMAPEILRGEPYTHAVDWWSLGIIVCQMFVKKSPDIRHFISINLPPHLQTQDTTDKAENSSTNNSIKFFNGQNSEDKMPVAESFLPQEVESLCHEAKDVLTRLLEFDSQKRLRSVRALQRIALYKDFKIEVQHCLKIHPLDIITADNIVFKQKHQLIENSLNANKTFNNF